MITVSIKRTEKETIVKAKTDVPGEKAFTFDSLSPTITKEHIRLILPMMIESQREKRYKKAHRTEELRLLCEQKAEKKELYGEVGPNE